MAAHRVTEGQLFKILRRREVQDGFEASEVSSRVSAVVNEVWPILQQVSRGFPLYTLHDPEHSFRVAQNMAKLIPQETLTNLNCIELSILLYSAYLHDIGMASSQDEFYSWLDSDEYRAFMASHDKWAYDIERSESNVPDDTPRKRKRQGKHPTSKQSKTDNLPTYLRRLQDVIYTDFLRENHAVRGTQYIVANFGSNGKSDNKIQIGEVNYAEHVSIVCKSHWDSAHLLRNSEYRRDSYIGNLPVNLQYCSVILRLADLVDLDPERTPRVLLDFILLDLQTSRRSSDDLLEQSKIKSAEEWAKHRSVLGYKITPDEIRIEAKCSHPAIQRGLREWCEYIDIERRDCRLIVQENSREITEKYDLRLANDVRKDLIQSNDSYIYTDFRFQLDYDRIVSLLMGTELWGDPSVVFRELLQNALDACRHRQALSQRLGVSYTPKISFHITEHSSSRQAILTCSDNGTGMNQHIIENFLMRIGRSYYSSTEFRRQNLDIYPISQFGLGIMSCFMLTDKVHIETQHIDESLRKEPPLSVHIDSSGQYVILSPLKDPREGTAVSLAFDFRDEDEMFHSRRHRNYPFHHPMMFFEMPHYILTSLAMHLDIPIEISCNEHDHHTIEPGAYTIPEIEWDNLPCMKEHCHEFTFKYNYDETDGLAGTFRFLLPRTPDGKLSLGLPIESRFKMFIDPDGDLCLTTPNYKDDDLRVDFVIPDCDDWDTDEIRGIYRDRYGRKPPASEERFGSANSRVLEIVKSAFRWSQDGLLVGRMNTPWEARSRKRDSESEDEHGSANLLEHVPIPGLNAADIDIRGLWRLSLNVQRSDFIKGESLQSFIDRYYSLAAKMWREILTKVGVMSDLQGNRELLDNLFERSDWKLRSHLSKTLGYHQDKY